MRLALLLVGASLVCAADPLRIAIVGGPQLLWPEALVEFQHRHPTLAVSLEFRAPAEAQNVDLVFAYYPTPEQLSGSQLLTGKLHLGFPVELVWTQPVDAEASKRAAAYLDEGGLENCVRLLLYLYSLGRPSATLAEKPISGPRSGIYHPAASEIFSNYAAYRDWWRTKHAGEPVAIAISFFSTWLRSRDLAVTDAMIQQIEARGLMPVAAFGYPVDTLTPLLTDGQSFQPAVVIALNATLSSPKDADVYNAWGVPVLNGLVTRESSSQWRANSKGIPADRMAAHFSYPERAGLIAPTLAATTETSPIGIKTVQPVRAGIQALTDRAVRMLTLRDKPNAQKRVAIIYYNNPAGRGNVGASYLQVFPSLKNILAALNGEGYTIPWHLPNEQALRQLIETGGRNLEIWSAGELRQTVESKATILWPMPEYRRYYDALPEQFRQQVEATWGTPEQSQLMTAPCATGRCFVLPAIVDGNIMLAAQPLRTTFDQASDPAHERITAPPHQYVAFYLWLQHEWKADALIHLGRHGTLEWLPGKQTALAPEDAPSVLIADLPNFNIYVMDGGGEAIQAKRRGKASLISHLTPMIWRTGGRADLEKLHQSFQELMDRGDTVAPALAAEHEKVARAELKRLGLDKQLKLDMTGSIQQLAPALHRFLHQIEDAPIPAGLPIFGQPPNDDQLRQAVGAYLFSAFPAALRDTVASHIPAWSVAFLNGDVVPIEGFGDEPGKILARVANDLPGWIQSLRDSGPAELHGLLNALAGKHLPSHLLGDPLRKPEALPTGANLHAIDSARIPTEAAWRVGQQMARDFLDRYQETHHEPAQRVSLVLWYGETERHQGAMESMAMALLGVRPVWNARGIVEGLQLIPATKLDHARVDVVFTASGNYRDGFPEKLQLLDRAVRLAASAEDGLIAGHDRRLAAALEASGMDRMDAQRQSQIRVFSAKPGAYGVGVQYLVEKSGGADSTGKIAALYTANMGFGYSSDAWGVASEAALKGNLRSINAVQFSRSSNLYGSLDNDDTYQYVGALRTAAEALSGKAPDVLMHNLRHEGEPKLSSLREFLGVELHSRQLNPKWIEEMRKSGYAGAREISKEIEHLYGFQKTAPDHLDSATWQAVMDVFVKDKHGLGLKKFFQDQNPHGRQTMLARLLDVDRQGIYRFAPKDRTMLLHQYMQSVVRDGAACNALDCGSPVLRSHISKALRQGGMRREADRMDRDYEKALRQTPEKLPLASESKPVSPKYRLRDLKQIGKYLITWVEKKKVLATAKSVPLWLLASLVIAYMSALALKARGRRRPQIESLGLFPNEVPLP